MSQTTMITLEKLVKENKIQEAKSLISSFIFKTTEGYFIHNDLSNLYRFSVKSKLFESLPDDIDNNEYIYQKRLPKTGVFTLKKYLQSNEFMSNIHYIDIDYSQQSNIFTSTETIEGKTIQKKMLNMKKALPFNEKSLNDINIDEYSTEIEFINNHIFEVLTSKNVEQFDYFLNFLAYSAKGKKIRTAIYLQTDEGVGKGILMNFLNKIFGQRFHKTSSVETITKYTYPLEGRCLINIDELTGDKSLSVHAIQDQLKGLITEGTFDCRDMFKTSYTQKNTFNIIITTNNNAIHLSINNRRRYICLDVSNHRIGDFDYFTKLQSMMDKPNVVKAYYKYLLQRYEDNVKFNFDIKPSSKQETYKITIAMPPLLRYIKEKYILNQNNLNIECKKFVARYNEYIKKNIAEVVIHKELKDRLGLVKKRVRINGGRMYIFDVDLKTLIEVYKKNKWIVDDEIDDDECDDIENSQEYETDDTSSSLSSSSIIESQKLHIKEADELLEQKNEFIKTLLREKEMMEQKIKDMEDKLHTITITKDPIENSDELVYEKEEKISTKKKDKKKDKKEENQELHYSKMKVKELRAYCKKTNVKVNVDKMKKKDIIHMLDNIEISEGDNIDEDDLDSDTEDFDIDDEEIEERVITKSKKNLLCNSSEDELFDNFEK